MRDDNGVWKAAQQAHEMNRAYCLLHEDTSQKPWDEAEEWQRQSAYDGALALKEDATITPEQARFSMAGTQET